jgi:hypothetical protein
VAEDKKSTGTHAGSAEYSVHVFRCEWVGGTAVHQSI